MVLERSEAIKGPFSDARWTSFKADVSYFRRELGRFWRAMRPTTSSAARLITTVTGRDTASPGSCNDSFGIRAPAAGGDSLGSGTSAVSYSEAISGLTAGSTYYYCAIVQNADGTGFGGLTHVQQDVSGRS